MLVVGASLLVRTFVNVRQVDPGFDTDGMLSFRVALPGSRYGSPEAFNAFSRRLQSELAALPGVTGVSDSGRYAEVRLAPDGDPQLLLREAAARLRVTRFEIVEPSLHDIFVQRVTASGEGEEAA